MRYKIGVIGAEEVLFPFRQIGMDCFLPEEPVGRQVSRLIKSGYILLFISEDTLKTAPGLLREYDANPQVSLIPIPGTDGGVSTGSVRMEELVEKALGQKLVK